MPRRRGPLIPIVTDPSVPEGEFRLVPGVVHHVRDDMVDATRYAMESMREREMRERERGRDGVHIEFITHMDYEQAPGNQHRRQVQVSVGGRYLRFDVEVLPGMSIGQVHRDIAREAACRFSRDLEDQLRAQMMQAERNYQHDIARQRERAYTNGNRTMGHAWDLARAALDRTITKNIPLKSWFKHKEFELEGWKAILIETEEQIKAEGENMEHCFANAYRNRIAKEEYIGYHISAPDCQGLPKSGFTLGFHVDKGAEKTYRFDQVKGKKNQTHHCQNPALLAMIELIDKSINKAKPKLDKKSIKKVTVDLDGPQIRIGAPASVVGGRWSL